MLGMVDQERGTLRLSRLIIPNVIAILLLTELTIQKIVPLYPWAVIGCIVLYVVNLLVVRRATRQLANVLRRPDRVPKGLWIGAAAFTPAGVAQIVICIRKPDIPSMVQMIIAILLVGYIWFLIYRVWQRNKKQAD